MSILIKGMEMPKSCYVCPFCDYVSARCDAVKGNPYTPESRYEKRADFCPLVPVPPHGRLKDEDELIAELKNPPLFRSLAGMTIHDVIGIVNDAPTIIEAERNT